MRKTIKGQALAIIVSVLTMVAVVFGVVFASSIWVNVGADEIVVVQHIGGQLDVHTDPGIQSQWMGTVTRYKKSSQFWFSKFNDQGQSKDQSIPVRFNDGAIAKISGSVRFDLPMTREDVLRFHTKYGSMLALDQELVRTVIEKAVYLSGTLMSARESYAERKSELLSAIEDQTLLGVFQTSLKTVKTLDPVTGKDKYTQIPEILKDKEGHPVVHEASAFKIFNIHAYNFLINSIDYPTNVEEQIQAQQKALMDIQTSLANGRKAEQDGITAVKLGEASAAKAKWDQEVLKSKAVTEAEQQKEVAKITAEQQKEVALIEAERQKSVALTQATKDKEVASLKAIAAESYKKEQVLIGQGDAERKRLALLADNAIPQKLETYKAVMHDFAQAIGQQRWVPSVVMGGQTNTTTASNPSQQLVEIWTAKGLHELGLDMDMQATKQDQQLQVKEAAGK